MTSLLVGTAHADWALSFHPPSGGARTLVSQPSRGKIMGFTTEFVGIA